MPFTELVGRLRDVIDAEIGPLFAGKTIALLDFPDHSNVGDSAIWLGELAFLRRQQARLAAVASAGGFDEAAVRKAHPEGPIALHGGGSFGDIWPFIHHSRLEMLERFADRDIVQMPQSIHFGDAAEIDRTAKAIAKHGRFHLFVRDEKSLAFAKQHFDCPSALVPDMAFAMGTLERRGAAAQKIVYLLRTDLEAKSNFAGDLVPGETAEDWLAEPRTPLRIATGLALLGKIAAGPSEQLIARFEARATQRTERGLKQLSRGGAVITDRLHAHILSVLLGIPHAILDNSYGKITGFHDKWTSPHPLILRAGSIGEARDWVASLPATR